MYPLILFIHSWLRWFVLILLIIVIFKFIISLLKNATYSKLDRVLSSLLLGFTHLQFVMGLILYFVLSPIVPAGLSNIKGAMKNATLRYWTVEHLVFMVIFTVFIQIGFSLSKRAADQRKKHRLMFIYSAIAFIILMVGIPWPMREYGRVLFRF